MVTMHSLPMTWTWPMTTLARHDLWHEYCILTMPEQYATLTNQILVYKFSTHYKLWVLPSPCVVMNWAVDWQYGRCHNIIFNPWDRDWVTINKVLDKVKVWLQHVGVSGEVRLLAVPCDSHPATCWSYSVVPGLSWRPLTFSSSSTNPIWLSSPSHLISVPG